MLGVAVDAGGTIVHQRRAATPSGAEAVVAVLAEMVDELRRHVDDVVAVGVGVPGLVDGRGTLRFAPNLPGVVELDLRRLLAVATGLAVRVDNDATCALRAEHRLGGARGTGDAVLVTLGTGIGGGLLVANRLARGAAGFAGEVGHMVVEAGGRECTCGRRGCWERYASGSALGRMATEAVVAGDGRRLVTLAGGEAEAVAGEHVVAAAAEGDPVAVVVMERFAGWVALGLANLVHVLDVERCVIGGGLAAAGDIMLAPVRVALSRLVMAPDHRPPVHVVAAELGERAGAIGAALLAAERHDG